ncbi:MAG: hypothetical protein ABSE16_10915 [Verrucomicrobiota bacterium]
MRVRIPWAANSGRADRGYAVKSSFKLSFLESVLDVCAKRQTQSAEYG